MIFCNKPSWIQGVVKSYFRFINILLWYMSNILFFKGCDGTRGSPAYPVHKSTKGGLSSRVPLSKSDKVCPKQNAMLAHRDFVYHSLVCPPYTTVLTNVFILCRCFVCSRKRGVFFTFQTVLLYF